MRVNCIFYELFPNPLADNTGCVMHGNRQCDRPKTVTKTGGYSSLPASECLTSIYDTDMGIVYTAVRTDL
jgi:hypothetical protein